MKTLEPPKMFNASLRTQIRKYQKYADEIKEELKKAPFEWGRYQSVFNQEVNMVFYRLMEFERDQLKQGREESVYKMKKLFLKHLRKDFLYGDYIRWSLEKPYGYAGDFKIIDDIYRNAPRTEGFDRLYDNYFQMSSISVAVRNRKEDFKKQVLENIRNKSNQAVKIMDLACGPCEEVVDIFTSPTQTDLSRVEYHCYDNDENAIEFSRRRLLGVRQVEFFKENAVRLALKKDVSSFIPHRYDVIYSTGLFDYFDYRICVRLVQNLKKLLKPDGLLAISDVRDKFSNPSVHFMEWVGDWNLVYRDDENFRQVFFEAGFKKENLSIGYEQQGILQYIYARNH